MDGSRALHETLNKFFLGIIGLGRIGQTVQKMLTPFGVAKFVYTGRSQVSSGKYFPADILKMIIISCHLQKWRMGPSICFWTIYLPSLIL
jgi:lactate dehydrogenase-like 2-hydroxyacid dehydrogenase